VRLGGSENPAARPPKVSPLATLAVGTFVGSLNNYRYYSIAVAMRCRNRNQLDGERLKSSRALPSDIDETVPSTNGIQEVARSIRVSSTNQIKHLRRSETGRESPKMQNVCSAASQSVLNGWQSSRGRAGRPRRSERAVQATQPPVWAAVPGL
jgi:hypothetical protein